MMVMFQRLVFICSDMSGKSKLMKECAMQFIDEKFESKLDVNPYLIGFDNGIYDINDMVFREGNPSDHVSLTTKYEYKPGIKIQYL